MLYKLIWHMIVLFFSPVLFADDWMFGYKSSRSCSPQFGWITWGHRLQFLQRHGAKKYYNHLLRKHDIGSDNLSSSESLPVWPTEASSALTVRPLPTLEPLHIVNEHRQSHDFTKQINIAYVTFFCILFYPAVFVVQKARQHKGWGLKGQKWQERRRYI